MRSGIMIRVGTENVDIINADHITFRKWWNSLDDAAKLRTVYHLCAIIDEQ